MKKIFFALTLIFIFAGCADWHENYMIILCNEQVRIKRVPLAKLELGQKAYFVFDLALPVGKKYLVYYTCTAFDGNANLFIGGDSSPALEFNQRDIYTGSGILPKYKDNETGVVSDITGKATDWRVDVFIVGQEEEEPFASESFKYDVTWTVDGN